jgi:hypothetical protein
MGRFQFSDGRVRLSDGRFLLQPQAGSETEVDSAVAHYDATELELADGDSVSTWPDLLGNYDASAVTAPTYRANGINGHPSVEFDGTATAMDTGFAHDTDTPYSLFVVVERLTTGSRMFYFGHHNATAGTRNYEGAPSSDEVRWSFADSYTDTDEFPAAAAVHASYADGLDGSIEHWQDDASLGTLSYTSQGAAADSSGLGARHDPANNEFDYPWDGYIGEVVVAGDVTAEERKAETLRLLTKWDIDTVVDTVEDGNLSEYTIHHGSPSAAADAAYVGEYGVAMGTDGQTTLTSTSGLPAYFAKGDTSRVMVFVPVSPSDSLNVLYGATDDQNFYAAAVEPHVDKLSMYKRDAGTWTTLDETAVSYDTTNGEWIDVEVEWRDNDDHIVRIINEDSSERAALGPVTDATHATETGVGFRAYGDPYTTDHFRIVGAADAGTLIDSFEDADKAEYTQGSPTDFSVQSSVAYDGTYALQHDDVGAVTGMTSHSGDGLSNYIDQGTTFQYKVRCSEDSSSSTAARPGMGYGVPSGDTVDNNGYSVNFYADQDKVSLLLNENGGQTLLTDVGGLGYTAGEWWTVRVNWQSDDTHAIDVYDSTDSLVSSGSITDTTHSGNNGSVGWHAYVASGANAYTDFGELV